MNILALLKYHAFHGFLQFPGMGQELIQVHLLEKEQSVGGPYPWAFMLVESVLAHQQLDCFNCSTQILLVRSLNLPSSW